MMLLEKELVDLMRKENKKYSDLVSSGEDVPESAFIGEFKVCAKQIKKKNASRNFC